ncbi:MAG: helix-turn-helix domain-containing protein [Deltaproteobacteria bacterium]|nr:helix-turn-helix domain-containing protein [Deltaproteobacteria bacterium]
MRITAPMPSDAIFTELGARLGRIRKQQGYSQDRLADEAGIGVATLRRIEDGKDAQLSSWLKVLKALGMASSIDGLLPESFGSPMAEALQDTTRARKKRSRAGFVWGDEES